jgi:hypothetical protein
MFALLCGALPALGKGVGPARVLPFPEPTQALETLQRAVTAVGVDGDRLIIMPREGAFAIVTPFRPGATTREGVFGKITDSTRQEIAKDEGPFAWTGVILRPNRVMFLDGANLALIESDPKSFKEIVRRSIPWDTLVPPRDRGGEATRPETAALRAAFKRAFVATPGLKLAGMAPLPDAWKTGKKKHYLAATRIKGYPLLMIECDPEDSSSCVVSRQCYLEGATDLLPEAVAGIAIDEKKRLVWIGDRKRMKLAGFMFHSCYHVTRRGDVTLPDRLKTLTNIAIDAERRLFLTTEIPDDYHNSSLFYWPSSQWTD